MGLFLGPFVARPMKAVIDVGTPFMVFIFECNSSMYTPEYGDLIGINHYEIINTMYQVIARKPRIESYFIYTGEASRLDES